jgi:hypothetical protein
VTASQHGEARCGPKNSLVATRTSYVLQRDLVITVDRGACPRVLRRDKRRFTDFSSGRQILPGRAAHSLFSSPAANAANREQSIIPQGRNSYRVRGSHRGLIVRLIAAAGSDRYVW